MRILIAAVFSALLLMLHGTPVHKQAVHRASVRKTTAVAKPSATQKAVLPQPVKVASATLVVQGCNAYIELIDQYNWDVHIAEAVMRAESGCNPNATSRPNWNGTVDRGLFQVNSIHADMVSSLSALYDPATNVATAYRIYSGGGWGRWTTYTNGAYLNYL